ncbi:bifunctional diguanylate cyclase/phosphodiesterase [Janthinobacterium sp.]|uniref:putative bifunctional diguanylate cyclase/phosphodiesterase n=1 Tax=Janthinobacterium sp. TaxID=1871054 RepID=UPI00289C12C9|nr:bifunctional diguanylate cyclase/phosphodiesterase [Janthinobacterium sp.]
MMATHDDDAYQTLIEFLYRAPIGLVQCDVHGEIDMLNPMSSQLLMPVAPEGDLSNLFDVFDGIAPQLRVMAAAFERSSGVVCEALRIPVNGMQETGMDARHAPQVLSISLLKLDTGRLMAVVIDASIDQHREQQRLAQKLSGAERIDRLTGLPNRLGVQEQLQQLIDRGASSGNGYAVLLLNCDRFRQINATFGEASGDRLLIMLADRLRAALRSNGQVAARFGGDEFVVVLDGMRQAADVHSVARRLLDAISPLFLIDGQQLNCTWRMGIVLQQDASGNAEDVLRDAGIAMQHARQAGSAHPALFDPAMREAAAQLGEIEADLRVALSGNQLFVVYQPVVGLNEDMGIDRGAAVEALVRWRHPVRGVVPPLEFIGIAEQTGQIGALGDFVLAQACHDFMAWQAKLGPRAPRLMAVNLSRAQLAQPDWIATVRQILAASGMRPDQLQLEVTESLAAQDEQVQLRLAELKALGVTLALDDFGTGYSSLSSLHLLPVDTVKIDRSFVCQADTSNHHRVLIQATISVARSLGMRTVAEGIETPAQAAVVTQLGCDKGQGYFFSRPLPSEALVEWLALPPAS